MGEPDEVWEERICELSPYKVTKKVMENAGEKAIFLHCLPAFHDLKTKIGKEMGEKFGITEMEVTDEVFESGQSVVFDEAENRMHTTMLLWQQHCKDRENSDILKKNEYYSFFATAGIMFPDSRSVRHLVFPELQYGRS